jgi:heat shock protein HslJ
VFRSLVIPFILAVTTIGLAACGDDDATPVTAPPDTASPDDTGATMPPVTEPNGLDLDGREFLSTDVEGYTIVDGTTIRLTFTDGSLSINAGCNTIFGGYSIDGSTLRVDMLGTTEMACEPELMAQDRWITDIVQLEPQLALDGDTLTISGAAGAVVTMVDRTVADPDRELVGVRWVADALRSQDAVSTLPEGVVASITFESTDDGDVALIEAGCNRGSANVEITDDVITFGPVGLTKMMCDDDAMGVESFMLQLLDGDVGYTISAGTLVLDSADTDTDNADGEMGGTGLILQADEG